MLAQPRREWRVTKYFSHVEQENPPRLIEVVESSTDLISIAPEVPTN